MDYSAIVKKISKDFPKEAIEIGDSLDLLENTIEELYDAIGKKANNAFSNREFDRINELTVLGKEVEEYKKVIGEIIESLSAIDVEDEKINDEEKTPPNYEDYKVDHTIPYSLYDDFTHRRPYGYKINNEDLVRVNSWQEMLMSISRKLYKIDSEKFLRLESTPSMNGKKRKYFTSNKKLVRHPKAVTPEIYIEMNQSANTIRNLIVKLLRYYDYSAHSCNVFLRADYSNM